MWTAVPLFVALATFAAYTFLGNTLDVASALTALALFDILRFPLFMLPQVVNNLVEASISLVRVKDFLMSDEYTPLKEGQIEDIGVRIEGASFVYDGKKPKFEKGARRGQVDDSTVKELHEKEWEISLLKAQLKDAEDEIMAITSKTNRATTAAKTTNTEFMHEVEDVSMDAENEELDNPSSDLLALRRINFSCGRGELIAVVGQVGAGKSTFINSILGELNALSGSVSVKGRLALFPQSPFIMNSSLQDNGKFVVFFIGVNIPLPCIKEC
jgi:ABC-type transport system involved in cytochrome bd biosynthesis fused ATPase/permease subunit